MTLDFSVEGSRVFSAQSQGGFKVAARKEKSNTFTVTLDYDSVIKLVKDYASKEWLDTRNRRTAGHPAAEAARSAQGHSVLPTDWRRRYPPSSRRSSIVGFSVQTADRGAGDAGDGQGRKESGSGQGAEGVFGYSGRKETRQPSSSIPRNWTCRSSVSFTIEIRNEAKGPLSFEKLGYELFVNGESLVAGRQLRRGPGRRPNPGDGHEYLQLEKVIQGRQGPLLRPRGSFAVKGSASVKLPDEIRKDPIPLAFRRGRDLQPEIESRPAAGDSFEAGSRPA